LQKAASFISKVIDLFKSIPLYDIGDNVVIKGDILDKVKTNSNWSKIEPNVVGEMNILRVKNSCSPSITIVECTVGHRT